VWIRKEIQEMSSKIVNILSRLYNKNKIYKFLLRGFYSEKTINIKEEYKNKNLIYYSKYITDGINKSEMDKTN
jgi:hypothetical protein